MYGSQSTTSESWILLQTVCQRFNLQAAELPWQYVAEKNHANSSNLLYASCLELIGLQQV